MFFVRDVLMEFRATRSTTHLQRLQQSWNFSGLQWESCDSLKSIFLIFPRSCHKPGVQAPKRWRRILTVGLRTPKVPRVNFQNKIEKMNRIRQTFAERNFHHSPSKLFRDLNWCHHFLVLTWFYMHLTKQPHRLMETCFLSTTTWVFWVKTGNKGRQTADGLFVTTEFQATRINKPLHSRYLCSVVH